MSSRWVNGTVGVTRIVGGLVAGSILLLPGCGDDGGNATVSAARDQWRTALAAVHAAPECQQTGTMQGCIALMLGKLQTITFPESLSADVKAVENAAGRVETAAQLNADCVAQAGRDCSSLLQSVFDTLRDLGGASAVLNNDLGTTDPYSPGTIPLTVGGGGLLTQTPTATEPAIPPSTPSPQVAIPPPSFAGTWLGSYTCAQGLTGLTLTIASTATGALSATFSFYSLPGNPSVPAGSFAMKGQAGRDSLSLTQDHWLQQPPRYAMVDLVGTLQGTTLSGIIFGGGCSTFTVERQG